MRIVDANVLLYAVNSDSVHHDAARSWLDRALSGNDTVGFTTIVQQAFLRVATHPAIFERPLSVNAACMQFSQWTNAPTAVWVHPGPGHMDRLSTLLREVGSAANLVNDVHLAVLALEQRVEVVSYDRDFERFPGVTVRSPAQLLT
ncbi:toxin-antitoxin system PIN domain toxin [Micrococcales bacterium KH10]|nr:toxin-antitoxin system PIN domain toxin [Micrococcales bacterium KH10]